MSKHKDYYAILGVLQTAEEIVIRAAYKALAQRYHPDRHTSAKEEAHRRMAEINEAYSILSDANKRNEYDRLYRTELNNDDSIFEEDNNSSYQGADPLQNDWETAIRFYGNLPEIILRLTKISSRLAYTYKTFLLETKAFDKRNKIANDMEHQFLVTYFGSNDEIIAFARELILNNQRMAAKSLNNAIKVLGENADPYVVIDRIRKDFGLIKTDNRQKHPGQPPEFKEFLASDWGILAAATVLVIVMMLASTGS